MKRLVIKTTIATLIAGIFFFGLAVAFGIFEQQDNSDRLKLLSNCAFVVGAIFVCIGTLVLISSQGTYDGLSYSVQRAISILPFVKRKMSTSYYEYKQAKLEANNTNSKGGISHVLISGGIWVVVAVVFMLIY
ncbi:MAG: DUF3899 domain-containing protein [Firmicutes bacterium]|nr:DUF3899 domain-containing protein [Bacillota bacterium]MCL1953553.1 DUF3899 domain-containing protein [Bacillota bacterium]